MVQKLANLSGTVKITGHSKKSILSVIKEAAKRSRNTINPRTGQPFTIFQGFKWLEVDNNVAIATFRFIRNGIYGNFDNDVIEFVDKEAVKQNKRMNAEIVKSRRVVIQ